AADDHGELSTGLALEAHPSKRRIDCLFDVKASVKWLLFNVSAHGSLSFDSIDWIMSLLSTCTYERLSIVVGRATEFKNLPRLI
ncbi:hypothetical protein PFISCL1PPCAC_16769, partial [Pristionchus fissidentatus]